MPELVPVDLLGAIGCQDPSGIHAAGTSACSGEAQDLARAVASLRMSFESSQALFGRKLAALSDLRTMVRSCSAAVWDGGEAAAISPRAIARSQDLIRALPDDIEIPEFAPKPDGSISLDWISSRHHLLSIRVGPTDRLPFAWLDGTDSGHGVVRFDGDLIPMPMLGILMSTVRHG